MRLHERTRLVQEARIQISESVWTLVGDYDLTYGEALSIVNGLGMDFAKYLIRTERHPDDPDEKGDEA